MVSKPKKRRQAGQVGRPAIPEEDRRSTIVRVLTTADEHEELKQAAADADMTLSTWVRRVAIERARALAAEKEAARDQRKK